MANKNRFEVTAELFLKTSNASKDAKQFAEGIRQQLNNIENAADNFTVFKDLIGYIAQVDKNLTALIANHKDDFKGMVSGLDEGLHNQYEEMLGVSGETLQKLDILREKLSTIKIGAKPEEVRKFVTELNGLFTAVGSDMQLNPSEFKQKITQDMVDKVTVAFGDFEKIVVDKVSNLKNNLNLGGIGIGSFSEGVQKELKGLSDQLFEAKSLKKELESTLSAINKSENGDKVALDTKPTEESVKKLIEQYNKLEEASKNLTNGTNEYYSNLTKRANIGMQLYAIKEHGYEFRNADIGKIVDSNAFSKINDELKSKSQEIFTTLDQTIQTTQQKVQDFMTSLSSGSGQGGERLAAESTEYDNLKKKIQEYYELRLKLENVEKNSSEYNSMSDRQRKIQDEIYAMKALSEEQENAYYNLFDRIDSEDSLQLSDAVTQFCNILKIDIPNSAEQASSATTSTFAKITEGAKQADEAVQNVMYHLGNLLNGKGQSRDTFGDMAENLTKAVQGNTKYEQYGFGVLGGGLFGVVDPSVMDQEPRKSNFIQSIDISKYNMYMADTEERATALMDFLSKLQKFSMKSAEPNYTGFDSYLQNVTTDSLYDQFKVIFEQSDLTKEQFLAFINEMVSLLKQAGLAFDSETGVLDFTNISKEMANSENISTRFMKMLGFEGVNTGTTSFGGFGQGSVLFDFKESDIVGYFDSVKAAVQDYEQIVQQANDGTAWIGTTEQLQQYASNVDSIIDRITQYKNSGILKDTSELDVTLSKLIQIKENINDILSGKNISGNSPQDTTTKVAVPSANSNNLTKTVPVGNAIDSANVTTETAQLQNLLGVVNQVTSAVNAKTKAFAQEYVVVDKAVQLEIDALNRLKESLMTIQSLIQSIFNGNIVIGDMKTTDNSVSTNTMSTSLSTVEQTLNSIYGVLQGFTGIQAENKNSMQYKGTSPEHQTGVQSLNDAANTLNNAASNIIDMIQGPDGVWHAASSSGDSSNNTTQLADTAQQAENSLVELGTAAQNTSNYLDSVNGGGSSNDDSNGETSPSDGGYALENTLQQTNNILGQIASGLGSNSDRTGADALQNKQETVNNEELHAKNDLVQLTNTLNSAVKALRDAANGIVHERKAKTKDVSAAMNRITDKDEYKHMSDIAINSIGDRGTDAQIKSMKALANGIVQVNGAFKNVEGQWEGFVTKISESGGVVDFAVDKQSAFANALNKTAEAAQKASEGVRQDSSALDIARDYINKNSSPSSSDAQRESRSNYMVQKALDAAFGKDSGGLNQIYFSNLFKETTVDDWTEKYQAFDQILQRIGYHLGELQPNDMGGFSAKVIANSENVVTNFEQARDILFGINQESQTVNDNIDTSTTLEQQAAQLTAMKQQAAELYKSLQIKPIDASDSAMTVKEPYTQLRVALEQYQSRQELLTDSELAGLKQIYDQLMANAQAYAKQNENAKQQNDVTYGSSTMTMAEAKNNALWNTLNGNDKLLQSGKINTAVKAYMDAFEELKIQYSSFQNSNPTEKQKEGFIEARTNCSNLRQEVERLVKSYNTATTAAKVIGFEPLKDFDNRKNELLEYVQTKYPTAEVGNFNAAYTTLSFTIKNADGSFTDAKASINSLGTAITTTAGETQKSVGVIGSIVNAFGNSWKSFGSYLAMMFSWRRMFSVVKQGVTYVREIDSALTELKKVTDETSTTYDNFLQTMSKTASQTGSTVKDLTSSAADWARLGLNIFRPRSPQGVRKTIH